MKKVVLIEDEIPARNKLRGFLQKLEEPIEILGELASVQEAMIFLRATESIDLIISDVQLLDGISFEIFENVQVNCPIIFTTAYDRYLMDAFEANGIDYLLKPFGFARFLKSWEKYLRIRQSESNPKKEFMDRLQGLLDNQILGNQKTKTRIRVSSGPSIYLLEMSDVAFFLADGGLVWAVDLHGKRHLLRQATLKEIEEITASEQFYRINRAELVNKSFVEKLERFNKNTISISLKNLPDHLVTSQNSTAGFLEWLEN